VCLVWFVCGLWGVGVSVCECVCGWCGVMSVCVCVCRMCVCVVR